MKVSVVAVREQEQPLEIEELEEPRSGCAAL